MTADRKGASGVERRKGPLGDVRPGPEEADPRTPGGQPPEKVEDRPVVGQVRPEDYPAQDRKRASDL